MNDRRNGPDPKVDGDRLEGSTAPERGSEGTNVAGRPAQESAAVHEPRETADDERTALSPDEALAEGGSFDAIERDDHLEGLPPTSGR